MFDNYQNFNPDYIPNNIVKWHEPLDGVKDIIRGTNPEHFIYVPFDALKEVDSLIITYKQGYNIVNKYLSDISTHKGDINIIYYRLSPEETMSFKSIYNEPCEVQMKALLKTGRTIISDIHEIRILDILTDEEL